MCPQRKQFIFRYLEVDRFLYSYVRAHYYSINTHVLLLVLFYIGQNWIIQLYFLKTEI